MHEIVKQGTIFGPKLFSVTTEINRIGEEIATLITPEEFTSTIGAPVYVDDIIGIGEGIIERIDEYKYLGWWFSETYNKRGQLHEIKSISGFMVREIKIMGDKIRVGRHDGRIHKIL